MIRIENVLGSGNAPTYHLVVRKTGSASDILPYGDIPYRNVRSIRYPSIFHRAISNSMTNGFVVRTDGAKRPYLVIRSPVVRPTAGYLFVGSGKISGKVTP